MRVTAVPLRVHLHSAWVDARSNRSRSPHARRTVACGAGVGRLGRNPAATRQGGAKSGLERRASERRATVAKVSGEGDAGNADPNDVDGGAVDRGKRRDDAPAPSLASPAANSERLCVLFAAGGTVRHSRTPRGPSRSGGGAEEPEVY